MACEAFDAMLNLIEPDIGTTTSTLPAASPTRGKLI